MRLWSLHPRQLDRAALVACWREALLAQKVLAGGTTGYRHHPQLQRFRVGDSSASMIAGYLSALADEADARGYRFDRSRIAAEPCAVPALRVTDGQLSFELDHLRAKVAVRAADWRPHLATAQVHPLFEVVTGPIEPWERAAI